MGRSHFHPRRLFAVGLGLVVFLLTVAGSAVGEASGQSVAFFDGQRGLWTMEGSAPFFYGVGQDQPMLCDWSGDGLDTVGQYRSASGFVYLRNSNTQGVADIDFFYGVSEDLPVCGDWDGDGRDTVGVYRPSAGRFFLRNSNTTGFADIEFGFGTGRGVPVAGDWDGDGIDSVGLWQPGDGLLLLAAGHSSVVDSSRQFGNPGDRILTGDWDRDGRDTVAVYRYDDGKLHLSDLGERAGSPLELAIGLRTGTPVAGATGGGVPQSGHDRAAVPPGAISVERGQNIQQAAEAAGPGATLYLRAGVHRAQRVQPSDGQTFIGEPGSVMSGARILSGWQQDGSRWFVEDQFQEGRAHGRCETGYMRCNNPEDLFLDGQRLAHVDSLSQVGSESWFFDYGADRIYVGRNPTGHLVETSVTSAAFQGDADNVTISGLIVERYANPAQHGAIDTRSNNSSAGGDNWLITDNEIRFNHGVGVKVSNNAQVLDNHIHHNGQLGIAAGGRGALFEGNEISHNGAIEFEMSWERGGSKFARSEGIVVRNNRVHHNIGPGLWSDVNAYDSLFEGNEVIGNTRSGIFYEISYKAVIRNNYIEGNGFGHSAWLWGAGIVVAGSPDVEIYGNTVVGNADGIAGIEQDRTPDHATRGPHIVENLYVHDNTVTMSEGLTGLAQDIGNNAVFSRNNRFENNTFNLNGSGNFFEWDNRQMTYDGFRSFGQS